MVIAIITVLVSMLLPAIQRVRKAANRTTCKNNLHQLGIALHNYASSYGSFPAGRTSADSWTSYMLPYIEQENPHKTYKFDVGWKDLRITR